MKGNSTTICKIEGHNQQILKYLCINKNCAETICCDICLTKIHQSHISDCLDLNQLHQYIEINLKTEFQRMSQQAQNLFQLLEEKNEKILNQLKNTFQYQSHNDNLINCKEYANNRKYQILHFLEISKHIQLQVINLQQTMREIEEQVEIMTEKIQQSQNQMKTIQENFMKELYEEGVKNQLKMKQQEKQLQNSNENIEQAENLKKIENSASVNQQEQQIRQRKIIFLDSSESENDTDNEKINDSQQQVENQICQQEITIPPEDIFQDEEFILDYQEYLELKKSLSNTQNQYTDSTTNKIIFESSQNIKRISQIFQQPITFFCCPYGQNVFASDGVTVKIKDIIYSTEYEDFFLDLIYYIASFCPNELKNIFITKEYSPEGLYAIKLNDIVNFDSEIITQTVDDFIPYSQNIQSCKQICFHVLKKAIAKLFGGYYNFIQFQYLTTVSSLFDCTYIALSVDQDQFLEKVKDEIICQSLILIDFFMEDTFYENKRVYQILDLVEVKNLFDEIVVLFKIKTSQSRYNYKGEWGFQSPLWTNDLKLQLKISEEDDGIFYMDFISFIQKTQMLYCIRIKQKLLIHQNIILRTNQGAYFALDLNEDQNLAFWLNLNEDFNIQGKYFFFKILISNAQNFQLEKSSIPLKQIAFSQFLRKGKYIFYLKCPSITRRTLKCIIQIHGSQKIEFNQIQKIENYKNLVFERQIEKVGKKIYDNQLFLAKYLDLQQSGWQIYKFYNKSQNPLRFQMRIDDSNSLSTDQFCKPYSNNLIQQMIQKGNNILIIIKTLPELKNYVQKPQLHINDKKYEL